MLVARGIAIYREYSMFLLSLVVLTEFRLWITCVYHVDNILERQGIVNRMKEFRLWIDCG